jgi:acetoin utilization deacetylase AcuC-like enzyme
MPDAAHRLDGELDVDLSSLVVVDDPDTELHDPRHEVWVGVATPASEVAERVRVIRAQLLACGARPVPGAGHSDDVLADVHDVRLLDFLRTAAERWASGDYDALVGQQRVVPYVFPTAELLGGLPLRLPAATHALTGVYCYDTMTLVGPGTWQAARTAADLAQTAAELALAGRTAYALCRPPGHHATRGGYGGSCYLNNAAVAAQTMRDGGLDRVAVVDIDAHHGNGTQSIFYARDDVWYGSVHVDPGAGWFPHFLGFADETGSGAGEGFTCNLPLPPGSGDDPWLSAVQHLAAAATSAGCQGLVVSLGVDAAVDDPESPLQVSAEGFAAAGRMLAGLELPTALVQEGGYHLPTVGPLVAQVLSAFVEAPGR